LIDFENTATLKSRYVIETGGTIQQIGYILSVLQKSPQDALILVLEKYVTLKLGSLKVIENDTI